MRRNQMEEVTWERSWKKPLLLMRTNLNLMTSLGLVRKSPLG